MDADGHSQIAVEVQIVGGNSPEGITADGSFNPRLEGTVAVTEEDADRGRVQSDEVEYAVAVEVAGRDVGRHVAYRVVNGKAKPIAIAEHDGKRVLAGMPNCQVGNAVAVEVSGGERRAAGEV